MTIMKRIALTNRYWLAIVALSVAIWAVPGRAQSPGTIPQDRQGATQPQSENLGGENGVTRGELLDMDMFLDIHPEIAEQLRKDPSLVNNPKFVAAHPALQQFLAQHPGVRREYEGNPTAFMREEERFVHDTDITRAELVDMDHFLDSHPEIAEQLRKDPSLVDNQKYLADHPALKQFLAQHPGVQNQIEQNPNAFMRDEDRMDRNGDRDGAGNGDRNGDRNRPDITRGEVATMDQFLDKHPEIAEQLQKNPKLIDDKQWVANHPALQQFMADHPGVRREFDEHPYAFMRDEDRYERREDRPNGDMSRGQLSSFHEFMEGHGNIAAEISKNPTLATNDEYLQNHTELQAYLQANPEVKQQLNQNPQSFIKSAQGAETTTPGTAPKTMPKMPGSDPK